jgi:hypothetical protein
MVGKRTWASNNDANYPNEDANIRPRNLRRATTKRKDKRERPHLGQFHDSENASPTLVDAQRREELKQRLLHSVDTENWEKCRKSKEEVCIDSLVFDKQYGARRLIHRSSRRSRIRKSESSTRIKTKNWTIGWRLTPL